MRKLLVFFAVLVLIAASTPSPAFAAGKVEYTWTIAALGQDGWIGGPLFSDGSVGGGGAFSADNGQTLASLVPTHWSENAAGEITVCFDIVVKRGVLPPSLCIGPAAPTETPTKIIFLGEEHIFRVTELR